MKKASVVVAVVVLMATSFAVLTILPANVKAATLYVGGAGPGNYTTIQAAIDNANPGATVFVYNGTYDESVGIDKTLSLVGEDANSTVINGTGWWDVVNITADRVNVTGFTITNSSLMGSAGVELWVVENCTIKGNIVSNDDAGISLYQSSGNTIASNIVASNQWAGIFLSFSHGNTIDGNDLYWEGVGIELADSNSNVITNNTVSTPTGIFLYYTTDNTVAGNTINGSHEGIYLRYSSHTTIANNTISNNDRGVTLPFSDDNRLFHNDFIENGEQAYDPGSTNSWDNGYPSGGNYWSDYQGIDEKDGPNQDQPGSDGIGDTPYVIDADSQDNYPLMSPSTTVLPRPPVISQVALSGGDMENVSLTWSLSPDDGSGLGTVVAYRVFRNNAYDPKAMGYSLVASLPNGTSEFVDNYTGEGNPSKYFYRVCSVYVNNDTACSENQAAKFTRPLATGPNLTSIPLIQSDESIETVLQTVEYDKAWFYDSSSQEWKWYVEYKDYRRGLWNMNHTMGIWVNVTQNSNLTVVGVVPAQTTIHLHQGWNLVSFPSFNSSYTMYDLKMEIGAMYVEGYDPTPPYHLRVLGDAEVLLAGESYWVRAQSEVDWIVEVS